MRDSDDVPQTAEQAVVFGWSWMRVECLGCNRRRDLSLLDLKGAQRGVSLAGYARRLVCRNCKSRELAFALGAHRPGDGIGFGGTYRPISFRDGLAVRARRD
ncbi:hypothetical protein [Phreatobacter oligotrophus]|uniref:hypothetical protein n=1 Tax=Phreatobacter oligotrophus TaxID=1122261 RepID=UPI0023576CD6|nr:hypothetical protein [Phreatobacter oligotrophus]MBX9991286.1 hypothetical protein [Phreatobacter oligotrophus]